MGEPSNSWISQYKSLIPIFQWRFQLGKGPAQQGHNDGGDFHDALGHRCLGGCNGLQLMDVIGIGI